MGIESILILLIIGAIAGWLAGQLVKGYGFGLVGNIVVGIVGAFIAGLILPYTGLTFGGNAIIAAIIHATIGAVILLLLIRLVRTA
ncbi:GlsB/YeaQ/YmgE family stress response membrane protein [Pseudogemmobacter bohemicus]|uniref:GlsB/YeaQ/YmgE family stress response membrane protein n=1 Tax=Pseudogemmobacter bohemicus TaxID=2250708 RepID=UPI000DD402FD|nr:GlsB/YeaQ/YmgE family stress response membrane protein [Pseudogemmobacter bohemicus]